MRNANTKTVYRSFVAAVRTFYEAGPRFVLLSVVWFVCSLPLVTLGPATLGAYAALLSLRKSYSFDRAAVLSVLKRHGLSAMALTGVPLTLGVVTTLYALEYLVEQSTFLLVLVIGSAYAAVYTGLVLVPTFICLANGDGLESALRTGFRWTAANALGAITMAMGTLIAAAFTGLLTIAFVLVFGGFAFAFHIDVVLESPVEAEEDDGLNLYAAAAEESEETSRSDRV
jgi:hypothetical protein